MSLVEARRKGLERRRARGEVDADREQPCVACGGTAWPAPRSASPRWRCPACVATGRARCGTCGKETAVEPGVRTTPLCEDCRREGRPFRGYKGTPGVVLTCTGVELGGAVRHANTCKHRYPKGQGAANRLPSYDRETGTFRCRACNLLAGFVALTRRRAKAWREIVDSWKRHDEVSRRYAAQLRAEAKRQGKYPDIAAIASGARAAGKRLGGSGAGISHAHMVRAWRRTLRREVRACGWRGKLLLVWHSQGEDQPALHQACWKAAQGSPEGREWRRRRLELRAQGLSPHQIDRRLPSLPLPTSRGRKRHPEELTRNFGWTVRRSLGGETVKAIAAEASVTPPAVSQGITAALDLLPDPATADRHMRRYVLALREAAGIHSVPAG